MHADDSIKTTWEKVIGTCRNGVWQKL